MSLTCTADKIINHFYMKKIELLHFTVAKKLTTARLAQTVSSNNKKVSSSFFEQSEFEQFTPTHRLAFKSYKLFIEDKGLSKFY